MARLRSPPESRPGLSGGLEGWKALHPDWEVRLWTADNLPPLINQSLYYARPDFAHGADILRYELLYRFGGVYIDMDFEPRKALNPLIEDCDAFWGLAPEQDGSQYSEIALLGSIPGHPLFQQVVNVLTPFVEQHWDSHICWRTGPIFFADQVALWKASESAPDSGGREFGVTEFPPAYFYPYPWDCRERENEPYPDAYAIHRWWGAWNDWNGRTDEAVSRLTKPVQVKKI